MLMVVMVVVCRGYEVRELQRQESGVEDGDCDVEGVEVFGSC